MDITRFGVLRRAHGQGGFSRGLVMAGLGLASTAGSIIALNPGAQVAAAERTVCEYNHRVLVTALEADRVLDGAYAAPKGEDGFDELREAGLLRSDSRYWTYQGLDANGRPVLVSRTTTECDTGAADAVEDAVEQATPTTVAQAPASA